MSEGGARHLRWLAPILVAAAHWPVVHWFATKTRHESEELWELVALVLAIGLVLLRRRAPLRDPRALLPCALVTALYGLAFPWLPEIARGLCLATAMTLAIAPLWLGRRYSAGLHGLALLALPLIPIFQYQLGYPLRALAAQLAASLLRLGQLDVIAEGTGLSWAGGTVWVDAPCSGVRMLWAGMLVVCALALSRGLGPGRTLLAALVGLGAILLANGLRAASLFYLETGLLRGPAWLHDAAGLVAFALAGGLVFWLSERLGRRPCAA